MQRKVGLLIFKFLLTTHFHKIGFTLINYTGGMQDYNYNYAGCMEITMELNCCMFSPEGELEARWTENKDSLFAYIQQVHIGNIFLLY